MNITVERFCEWTNVAKRHILISSPIGQRLVTYTVVDNLIQNLLLNRKFKRKRNQTRKVTEAWKYYKRFLVSMWQVVNILMKKPS